MARVQGGGGVTLKVSAKSLAVCKVFPRRSAEKSPQATGFFVGHRNQIFFVTNWHVASGRHSFTKKCLSSTLSLPYRLDLEVFAATTAELKGECEVVNYFGEENRYVIVKIALSIELSEEDDFWTASTHPEFGDDVDVFVRPASKLLRSLEGRFKFFPIEVNAEEKFLESVRVMNSAYIAGFPASGAVKPNHYPIYKSASIASEPRAYSKLPFVLLDGKTKPGMSGSPVFTSSSSGGPSIRDGYLSIGDRALYAIYSGRDENDQELTRAELALAWPVRECLLPILNKFAAKA